MGAGGKPKKKKKNIVKTDCRYLQLKVHIMFTFVRDLRCVLTEITQLEASSTTGMSINSRLLLGEHAKYTAYDKYITFVLSFQMFLIIMVLIKKILNCKTFEFYYR